MKKHSLGFIAFLQATAITLYCSLVSWFMWNAERWFKYIPNPFMITIMILLFSVSALVCAYITLGQPVKIYFEQQNAKRAVKLVGLTAAWGIFYIFLILLGLTYLK
ncbi:hypothetical protein ACFL15_00105 [Patescibacteria group bacterium]